jgi:hypothetical protein
MAGQFGKPLNACTRPPRELEHVFLNWIQFDGAKWFADEERNEVRWGPIGRVT